MSAPCNQLGFDALLGAADDANRVRKIERETAHLPRTMDEGLAFYRVLLRQHHAAMLAADVDAAMALRSEAHRLALRLNGGDTGIIAGDQSAGNVLRRRSAAAPDTMPLWGQDGTFLITVAGVRIRVALEGVFGIGSSFGYWPGFAVHAVDQERPFISSTGYRSFLGIHAEPEAGLLPDAFCAKVIAGYLRQELKGRPMAIDPHYRKSAA